MAATERQPDRGRDRALAHPTRRALLGLLDGAELSSRELRARLPEEPPLSAVAYHLAVLREAGLVAAPIGGLYRLAR